MSPRRSVVFLLVVATLLTGCLGASPPPAPSDAPGPPVVTPDDAVQAVIAAEPRLARVRPFDPDAIGQSASYEVVQASGVGAFIVSVRVGWGDCQAGCIDEHLWVYAVGPDGTVTVQSQAGPPVPADAWPASGAGGTGLTGVDISVVAGPTCPVESEPPLPECAPLPVPGAVLVIGQAGAEVARVTTDAGGRISVDLPAGVYTVEALPVEGFMSVPALAEATIAEGRMTALELIYDTGIR